jgi:hypothetical protein
MTTVIDLDVPTTKKEINAVAIGLSIVIIMFMSPIGIADLVYGFKQEECLNEYPHDLHLNMKKYLLVSGFLNLMTCLYIVFNICYMKDLKEMPIGLMVINTIIILASGFFYLIWNILGSIVFWNFLYPERHCSSDVSSYLFASLIIKLVFTYMNIISNLNKKEE